MIPPTRFLLLLWTFLFSGQLVSGQSTAHLPGQLLVSLLPDTDPESLVQRGAAHLTAPVLVEKKISVLLNIWQFQTSGDEATELAALRWLNRQPEVRAVQFNHLLQDRSDPVRWTAPTAETTRRDKIPAPPDKSAGNNLLPNDPLLDQQWHYLNTGTNGGMFDADLDAEQAWDFTTGGLSAAGDTIVVAVIDGGVDFQHPDLTANAWINRAETPNDGLDNDQNGFIDDFRGWNTAAQNDDLTGQTTGHGTPVCGLLGARGDNGIGVAGVNWRVKIMFVASGGTEAAVLAAYDYVWAARCLYNQTNGAQGAFVTAVNCSWGINYGQPADAPLWCAVFDTLGAAGILSVAATANLPINVDLIGDLPTACPSDYLITVTSLQRNDQQALLAGWGAQSIDLGAYGQNVFTLGTGNTYGSFSGTSYAAPQVTGAVALLYAMPCANLIAVAKNDPSAAAHWAKELLLHSTTPNLSLADRTLTGGRLNLFNLLKDYNNLCDPCPAPFSLNAEIHDSLVAITWAQLVDYQSFNLGYRPLGQLTWIVEDQVNAPFILPVLAHCQPYEFSLQAYCQTGQASAWSNPAHFTTPGCCAPPSEIIVQAATEHSLTLGWSGGISASGGVVRYRIVGSSSTWMVVETSSNMVTLSGLLACAAYEVQVRSKCNGIFTDFSTLFKVTTAGCATCTNLEYCTANASQASNEWIAAITIGGWLHVSGTGGGGYQNFTGEEAGTIELNPLTTPGVAVVPGFYSTPSKEYFRIYVDFNADGDFEDANELAFDPGYAHDGTMAGYLQVPFFDTTRYTRLRVLMKAKNATNQPPAPCESFDFGQIEDYCVLLSAAITSSVETASTTQGALHIFPQPAQTSVRLEWPASTSGNIRLHVWNAFGQMIVSRPVVEAASFVDINVNDWKSGIYMVCIQTENEKWQGRLLKL